LLEQAMRLAGARIATGAEESRFADLWIEGDRLSFSGDGTGPVIDLSGYLILPGLINAHDHLEFGLFPVLGRRVYGNAQEWAADVYRPNESPVREHRAVDRGIRCWWGAIRNLLAGVTTVAHHNPWHECFDDTRFPVRVARNIAWAHSLAFEPALSKRYREKPSGQRFVIHAAEGTDESARGEIRRLDEMGVLGDSTVLVHAVALQDGDLDLLRARGCGIVWCPCSNLRTYGTTLAQEVLDSGIPVALGSDSPITADGDLRDDVRTARNIGGLGAIRIYEMVTCEAALVLGLDDGEGELRDGGVADLIAVPDRGQSPSEAVLDLKPAAVICGGRVRLVSEPLRQRFPDESRQPIVAGGDEQLWIDADMARLRSRAMLHLGPELRLGGKRVAAWIM
jgi:cytosine/adenosine deaminase-related metal-dependent hydrolase